VELDVRPDSEREQKKTSSRRRNGQIQSMNLKLLALLQRSRLQPALGRNCNAAKRSLE
jgi:hypothetical protein